MSAASNMPRKSEAKHASDAGAKASVDARRESKYAKQSLLHMYEKVVVERSQLHIEALAKEALKQPHFWETRSGTREPNCLRMLAMVASCAPKGDVTNGTGPQDGAHPDADYDLFPVVLVPRWAVPGADRAPTPPAALIQH